MAFVARNAAQSLTEGQIKLWERKQVRTGLNLIFLGGGGGYEIALFSSGL